MQKKKTKNTTIVRLAISSSAMSRIVKNAQAKKFEFISVAYCHPEKELFNVVACKKMYDPELNRHFGCD